MKFVYTVNSWAPEKSGSFKSKKENIDNTFIKETIDEMLGQQEHELSDWKFCNELKSCVKNLDEPFEMPSGSYSEFLEPVITLDVIHSGIAGIIIPINHGDVNDFDKIVLSGIGGRVAAKIENSYNYKQAKKLTRYHSQFLNSSTGSQNHRMNWHEQWDYDNARKIEHEVIRKIFQETYKIPVFEACAFVPGYRDMAMVSDMIDKDMEEAIPYVKAAVRAWVEINFLGKKLMRQKIKKWGVL